MNPGLRRSFLPQWLVLGLTILLGLHRPAQATPSEKKEREDKQDTVSTPTAPSKEEKTSKNNQDTTNTKSAAQNEGKTSESSEGDKNTEETPDKEESELPKKPRIRKPKPLEPAKLAEEDSLASLDELIVKQEVSLAPYVPLIQTIDIVLDYGRLAMNLWYRQERRYAGGLSILWRKNIQLSGTWGYNQLRPAFVRGNNEAYTVKGQYGSLGLAYFIKEARYNLYAGLHHGRSYFTNSAPSLSKDLTASWWELVIGSEQQLFSNSGIYAGLTFHLKGLGSFGSFEPATNYEVPGYGRSVSPAEPSISLYIKYQISFLKKQISFSAPKTN